MTTTDLPRSGLVPEPGPPERGLPTALDLTDTRSVVLAWLMSRGLTLALLLTSERNVESDVTYYGRALHALFSGGSLVQTLPEYPLPVLAIMLPQYLVGGFSAAFALLFAASMVGVDAAFTALLWKVGGRPRADAVRMWLWLVPAIGPMAYFRFDLVPGALAGAAVLAAIRRPALTGVLTALGAALKLWPAVLLPVFLIRRVDRRRVLTGFLLTGFAAFAISWAVGGWDRLISPLKWQSARGLQIESVLATPVMLARAPDPHGPWSLAVSQYNAMEIFGPAVRALVWASTALMAIALLGLAVLWWRAGRLPAAGGETLGWLVLTTTLVVTVTDKTLSPQYILWLCGPLCALIVRSPGAPVRRAARLLFAVCVLTQLEYPVLYRSLTGDRWTVLPVTLLLALRNVLLVVLTALAARELWRQTRTDLPQSLSMAA